METTIRAPNTSQVQICLTTLTDEASKSWQTRYFGWRNFDGLLALTWDNKAAYARKHGYRLFDESAQLDRSRPASWSKIRAVQRLLNEEGCDWVFWLDADTVVMNSLKRVEDFLPAAGMTEVDLLLAADDGGGYNAGVWLAKNTEWTRTFLQEWWDMQSFVKPPGLAKSGDNDALKHKTSQMGTTDVSHLGVPPRCTFNSFARFVKPTEYEAIQQSLRDHDWYLDEASYHKGDLIAHAAGVDNKVETIRMLLEEAV
jgi:mannan polymerase II complex MNN10 subunit